MAFNKLDDTTSFVLKLMLAGYKVLVSSLIRPVPKIALSKYATQASPAVVDDFNWFLLDTFGTKETCYVMGKIVLVSHATMERIREYERA